MSDLSHQVSRRSFWVTAAAVLGTFLVFSIVLWIGYLPARRPPFPTARQVSSEVMGEKLKLDERAQRLREAGILTPEERQQRLTDLRNQENQALTRYAWVDQAAGVVRLPIDRAIEIFVREANQSAASPSSAPRPAAPNR